jgi:hypothetical protein
MEAVGLPVTVSSTRGVVVIVGVSTGAVGVPTVVVSVGLLPAAATVGLEDGYSEGLPVPMPLSMEAVGVPVAVSTVGEVVVVGEGVPTGAVEVPSVVDSVGLLVVPTDGLEDGYSEGLPVPKEVVLVVGTSVETDGPMERLAVGLTVGAPEARTGLSVGGAFGNATGLPVVTVGPAEGLAEG